ncbi:MAG: hypothetical protein IPL35_01765 [Sphingobacteriales bacterium]|nr:hypothetical protein [Sphingobacteriales bacterium]
MKKIFFAIFVCAAFLSAQWAAAVEVVYSYNVFYNPEVGSYIEIYISVPAKSLNTAAQTDGSQKAAANIALWVEQGEQIKAYDKYILYSPNFAEADKSQSIWWTSNATPCPLRLYAAFAGRRRKRNGCRQQNF